MPKARLGVALLLPLPDALEVDGLRRALGDGAIGRIPPHITLVPPVNVREDRMGDALAVLRSAAATTRPLQLTLGPPKTFLPDTPVVYLAVGGDIGGLRRLRDAVFTGPLARTLTWEWVPHVTLADEAGPARIHAALEALADYRVDVEIGRVHLLKEGPGRVWEPIADAPFAPPAVLARGGLPLEITVSDRLDPEAAALSQDGRPFAVTARRQREVVGTAVGVLGTDEAHLAGLSVAAAERGQGIGSHLLAAVASFAAEAGCGWLVSLAPDDLAGFLRHRGWVDDGAGAARLRRRLG